MSTWKDFQQAKKVFPHPSPSLSPRSRTHFHFPSSSSSPPLHPPPPSVSHGFTPSQPLHDYHHAQQQQQKQQVHQSSHRLSSPPCTKTSSSHRRKLGGQKTIKRKRWGALRYVSDIAQKTRLEIAKVKIFWCAFLKYLFNLQKSTRERAYISTFFDNLFTVRITQIFC